ncbi:toxin VasX [Rhodanobacter sp. 115]
MAGSFDRHGYLAARKLAQSGTETRLNCSHYVVRRLRKGYLYVYYPQDKSWDYYATQSNGQLERMQADLHHGLGRSDAACARFAATSSNLLLTIDDPQRHPEFWVAFSEAPWTQAVRNQVAANPSAFMQHVDIPKDLLAFDGADLIKNTVLGFQNKPLPRLNDALARSMHDHGLGFGRDSGYFRKKHASSLANFAQPPKM